MRLVSHGQTIERWLFWYNLLLAKIFVTGNHMSDFRNLLDQQDCFRQLVDDIHTRNETFSKLVERSPGMKALQDSIDRFAELSAPMHKNAMAIQDSIRRFADVTEPMRKNAMAIQDSIG